MELKIVVIDGQGGRMGRTIIEELRAAQIEAEIIAVGTNSAATATMVGGKADAGATGENALIVNCRDADYIIGPLGIVIADSLHGEISPRMAMAVGQSRARKILLPVSRCNTYVVGTQEMPFAELVKQAVRQIVSRY
ncbi:MAG: DUF3842 family protein [Firmicutes bacterium]|nr:DUF3842 family protein [Bacillota bacterium]